MLIPYDPSQSDYVFPPTANAHFRGETGSSIFPADDEDEYEEAEGGNRLLGIMFGNVDGAGAGDLDIDYLDEGSNVLRSSVNLFFETKNPMWPLPGVMPRSHPSQEACPSSMVNVSIGTSSSSVMNFQTEPLQTKDIVVTNPCFCGQRKREWLD
ncbi:hypothetical protein POM88_013619 [Heracleum sosnowskyi]|uniref:Uncharacterized protein n=1 Tax=Heracleum sosnowskyi TaxID=360622 RepID=A0AAD8N4I5_9APIA|nr:hypothetical protein POM88_013619 [Heracleum sosnowskyi]